MDDITTLTERLTDSGNLLVWVAAVSLALATIWRTWLRHVARRTRMGVEAMIELRDLMKTELHLPGDETPGSEVRTSLREDLQALTAILTDIVLALAQGSERFETHDQHLVAHDQRLDAHDARLAVIEEKVIQ